MPDPLWGPLREGFGEILAAAPVVGIRHFLLLGAALFCLGLFTILTRRNAVALLMGVELVLNGANVCLVAASRFANPAGVDGAAMAIFVVLLAAAEAAVAFGLVIALYRRIRHVEVDAIDRLRA